jgi:hypothetical protein
MAKWVYNGVADWGLNGGIQQVAIRVAIATAACTTYANATTTRWGRWGSPRPISPWDGRHQRAQAHPGRCDRG